MTPNVGHRARTLPPPIPHPKSGWTREGFLRILAFLLFAGAGTFIVVRVERFIPVEHRMLVAMLSLISLYIVSQISAFKRFPWRILFVVLATFITFRYFLWRTFETLVFTGPFDMAGMALLYLAELHAMIIHVLSMLINLWPMNRPIEGGDPFAEPAEEEALRDNDVLPTVDIFIPTYTEPLSVVEITVRAAMTVDYPADRFNVYILDDGATVDRRNNPILQDDAWERHYALRRLAERVGAGYITREHNTHAKAGNLNHAMTKTHGDLILVLDCDHVPTTDILTNTVGVFMSDESVSLVQTPHFFINPTPVEKALAGISNVSIENDMFFKNIHAGLDTWNASYFCGSAALMRRSVLESIGGIATSTITEDAETSLIMHGLGFRSVYINRPMVCGLSPETFTDYVTQRVRWAQGMIQLLLLKSSLTLHGLTAVQRLCYFNSSFFWFFGLSRFIFFIAPGLFLIFGLKIFHASIDQILVYALPHVLSTFIVMDFFYSETRKPFFSEIYESVQALFLMPAIISVILNPLHPTFKITRKGEALQNEYLNPMASSFQLVITWNLIAIPMAMRLWIDSPTFRAVVVAVMVWCAYNIFMALISLGAFWEKRQVRRYHRINVREKGDVFIPRLNQWFPVDVRDLSLTGFGLQGPVDMGVVSNEEIQLRVSYNKRESFDFNVRVRRMMKGKKKVQFGTELPLNEETYSDAIRYIYGNSMRWETIWDKGEEIHDTPRVLMHFLKSGIMAYFESTYMLLRSFALLITKLARSVFRRPPIKVPVENAA